MGAKVEICHRTGNGFRLISVNENALPAHFAHGDGAPFEMVPNQDTVFDENCAPVTASVSLEKWTQALDADEPVLADSTTGPFVLEGDMVFWSFLVTNTGEVPLTQIEVTDTAAGGEPVGVVCPDTELAVGQSMTCAASAIAISGEYENMGDVVALSAGLRSEASKVVEASDPSHYFGATPALAIEKLTNGESADEPPGPEITAGTTVEWTYQVTNTGNVPLNDVDVVDDQGVLVDCPGTNLAPGASMVCTGSAVAEVGQYQNIGTATGVGPLDVEGEPVGGIQMASDASHYFGVPAARASLVLEKRTNGVDADEPPGPEIVVGGGLGGEEEEGAGEVRWTYDVTNDGDVPLSDIEVTDDQLGSICSVPLLAPGESVTCEAVALAEVGPYANLGTASGISPDGLVITASDPSHYVGVAAPAAGIDLETSLRGLDADFPPGVEVLVGETLNWAYRVTNTGESALTDIVVTDERPVAINCPQTELAVGEVMLCVASEIEQEEPGTYLSTSTVTATDAASTVVTDADPTYRTVMLGAAAIALEKRTNGLDADLPFDGPQLNVGDPVVWTYIVTNIGDLPLVSLSVTDSDPEVSPDCGGQTTLGPGESLVCTASGSAVAGAYENLGEASALDAFGNMVTADDLSHYVGGRPAIQVEKSTNGEDADSVPAGPLEIGSPVTWSYVVTNTGDLLLTQVQVVDDQEGVVSCPATSLTPGASMVCDDKSGTVEAGLYINVATASALAEDGRSATDQDSSQYLGQTVGPAIHIEKRVNGAVAPVAPGPSIVEGTNILFEYAVTNVGDADFTFVQVVDSSGVTVSCPQLTLFAADPLADPPQQAETIICSASTDAALGLQSSTAEARGWTLGGPPLTPNATDEDVAFYTGIMQDNGRD